MASFRERAEAELRGTTVENVQAQKSTKSNTSFRERAAAELTRSSQQANTAYRTQQRRQKLHEEEQQRKQAAQNKVQMQKLGRQTTRQRVDTGEQENEIGTKNYLSYRGTDPREIPVKELTQYQIDKAKREATEKQAAKTKSRNLGDTILDTANQGAGQGFVVPIAQTADFLANLVPNAAATIRGEENPEHTFTGQVMKPLTDATQKFMDWANQDTNASAQRVQEDTKDSKAGRLAAEIGAGVVGAIPNAVLAMMTAGGSTASTLAPQAAGLTETAANAVQKVAQNPSFQLSYLQTLGGAYQDAKNAGASEANATAAAFISAAANALVEVGGGLETLPGDLQAKDLSTFEQAKEWLTSALDEGKEEVVQGVISALTNKVAANSDTPYFSMSDQDAVINPARMGQEFGMGAAVGGILGGAELLGTKALNRIGQRNMDVNQTVDTDTATEQTMDPLDYAFQETMKPTKEQQAFDQAMEDTANWMLGKEKTATAEAGTESTKVNTDPAKHTPAEQAVIEEYQAAVDPAAIYFVDKWNSAQNENYKKKMKFVVGDVSSRTVSDVEQLYGLDTSGYSHVLSGNALEHIEKRHGTSGEADHSMADTNDLARMRYVLDNYDTVSPVLDKNGAQKYSREIRNSGNTYAPLIQFQKRVNGTYYVVEAVPDSAAKQYRVVSAYMTKAAGSTTPTASIRNTDQVLNMPNNDPQLTSEVRHDANVPTSTIPNSNQNVNQNQNVNSDNDMGAKKSDFEHEVKRSKTAANTIGVNERLEGVPKKARGDNKYTAITEKESLANAKARLEQNLPDELDALKRSATWTNEEFDMAMGIRDIFRRDADATGDWSKYMDWRRTIKEHGTSAGQALQSMAKWTRNTGSGIVSEAADILAAGKTRRKVDTDAVMDTVSDYANLFDRTVSDKSVDGLVQLIKDTAGERNTAYRKRKDGTQRQSKYLNWALDRIAGYAKSGELTGNVDSNLEITAANIQNPDVAFQFLQDFASTGILNIAADTQKVSKEAQIMALRRQGMLSKLATTMRNLVSNGGVNIIDTVARDISVPLDKFISIFTGTRSVSMDYGYLSKAARQGSLDGIAMASLETSLDVNGRENTGKYTSGGQRTFKMSGNAVERFISTLEALQGYEMYVTDEMSKGRTSAEVQRGLDKLYDKNKIKATDDSLRTGGQQEALYRTSQDETVLSNTALKVRDALNTVNSSIVGGTGEIALGDGLMPFVQVPANLADRAIDYSPAGLAKTTGKLTKAISDARKGNFTAADQARVVQSLGRNITGTTMIAIAAAMAANGLVRVDNPGGDDENKDKTAFERMQGLRDTQWNLSATKRKLEGGDPTWKDGDDIVSISFLEPFNANLTIGALLAEDMELEGQLTAETALKDSFTGSLTAILDLPMFDTFGDVYDAYQYSDKERTGDKLLDAGNTLVANEVSSLIPNWMKGIRQGLDPYQRDLYTKDDAWGQVADQYQAVFGKRSELPIKQDSFGRDMTNEGGIQNFLNANILPGYVTKYHTDETMDEIARVAEATGKDSVYPSRKAPDTLSIDGEKVPLSSDEQKRYQQVYGNTDEAIRSRLTGNQTYSTLSDEEKAKAHQYSEDYAKQIASWMVNRDYDTDDWVEELRGKSEAEIVETVLYKTFESAINSKEYSSKYEGMADLVDQDKLDEAMAITMMPEKMQTAYQNVAKAGGVSVDEWLDLYAYAYPYGKTEGGTINNEQIRDHALDYIDKQSWGDDKKTAAASAIFQFLTDTIPLERDVPYNWALNQGDSGLALVESGMSKTQKKNYEKYVKGHFDNEKMKLYLDAYAFKGTAKSDKDENGKTIKQAMEYVAEFINEMDLDNVEKIRFFLGLGYAEENVPDEWLY